MRANNYHSRMGFEFMNSIVRLLENPTKSENNTELFTAKKKQKNLLPWPVNFVAMYNLMFLVS